MKIIGIQKQSLLDYPGKISAILFTPGCNFRCSFCHNLNIVLPDELEKAKLISFYDLKPFFIKRRKFLDAIVITGGEPLLQKGLEDAVKELKQLGYLVKLDTNGTNPELLKKLIDQKLIDYVAMDIKTAIDFDLYKNASGNCLNIFQFEAIKRAIAIITSSNIDHEFRTTVVPTIVSLKDVIEIVKYLNMHNAKKYFLQNYVPDKTYYEEMKRIKPYFSKDINALLKTIDDEGHNKMVIELRGFY